MIFARYKGPEVEGFVRGRTYLASAGAEGPAGMLEFLDVKDESGRVVRVEPKAGQFEFVEEVYAVVTRKFNGFEAGEVVVATDASEDGVMLNVKGEGFCSAANLEVLDGTTLFPGVAVCEASSGKWRRVSRVDEALWVAAEGDKAFRSPEEFRFAVSHDGDLMVEPLVTCVMAEGCAGLTDGKKYYLAASEGELVRVKDDDGVVGEYAVYRFRMG